MVLIYTVLFEQSVKYVNGEKLKGDNFNLKITVKRFFTSIGSRKYLKSTVKCRKCQVLLVLMIRASLICTCFWR